MIYGRFDGNQHPMKDDTGQLDQQRASRPSSAQRTWYAQIDVLDVECRNSVQMRKNGTQRRQAA